METPDSVAQPPMAAEATGPVIIDNRTDVPDEQVREAVMAQFTESAGLQFGAPTSFQLYSANQGSMLNRSPFRAPSNIIEEIKLARQVADTDDDISSVIGQAIATAFGDGMQNQHEDEKTAALFNKICGPTGAGGMNMDRLLKEIYREYLIASQFTTLSLFTRTRYNFTPSGTGESIQAQLATPVVGVIPSENIRVLTNDIFGTGDLAYDVEDIHLREWLDEFFAKTTTAAKKNRMANDEPVLAALFTGTVEVPYNDSDFFSSGKKLYTLNQRMVHRTTMPKGASAYPRPLLTANFALLEAKRLLNIMDYALLQGGTNYIVIARQGSDQLPAQQPEIDNLVDQVRSASRTGVLVGDHRLNIDIITPKLDELLNPNKRKLLGRKMAMALLRIPEQITGDPGNAGAAQELEFTARTISSDRRDIKRHIEGNVYDEVVTRNRTTFTNGAPSLWFPKIVLSGVKDFFASVVQARDRGDIPRKWAVEVLGFDYEAGVAQRKREKENGDDEVMTPGSVPFQGDPGGQGRPPGSSSDNGRPGGSGPGVDPAQRQRQPQPGVPQLPPGVRGEAVAAHWDQASERTVRVGELTAALLDEYPDHSLGRMSSFEREALAATEQVQSGPVVVVPVNPGYEVTEVRAFRLDEGLSVLIGQRADDGALVAKALCFREPHFDAGSATERAMRWGFVTASREEAPVADPAAPVPPAPSPVAEAVAAVLQQPEMLKMVAESFAVALGGLVPDVHVTVPPAQIVPPEPAGQ